MSIRTAAYTRELLDPRDQEGRPMDPSPSIAALSARACHLWEVLSQVAAVDATAFPSVPTLARRMHVAECTVQRARAELVAAGVLAVDHGGGAGNPNRYRFPVAPGLQAVEPPRQRGGSSADPAAVDCPQPPRQRGGSDDRTPAPARANPRASAGGRDHEGVHVDVRDAIQHGSAPPLPDDVPVPVNRWRAIIDAATAAEHARLDELYGARS